MAILHRPGPARPTLPRRSGRAGTGQDFCPNHQDKAVMGIGIDPPQLAQPTPTFNNITKILVFIIM